MPRYVRPFKRKRGRHSGWAVQRANIQSIPRLTFKPMSIVRTSDYRCTFRVNLGACSTYNSPKPTYDGKDFNWFGSLNINSIFPWMRNGYTDTQAFEANTAFDPNNGMYHTETGSDGNPFLVNNTTFEGTTPTACPPAGLSYTQMIARNPDGSLEYQPTVAPGLFTNEDDVGYQYAEIGVLGAKLTLKFVPLPSQLDARDADSAGKQAAVIGHDTEPSELYCFLHTQSAQAAIDSLCNKNSRWQDLKDLPYMRARSISGNVSSQMGNYTTNKQGNAAVLQYKYGTSTVHQTDVLDEQQFWTHTDMTNGFKNPAELDHLTFGIRRHLTGPPRARCAPSGFIELRLEQIIMLRKPMSTRTIALAQQPGAQAAGGAAPGGGGGLFPQSAMNKGGAIGTAAGSLYVASLLASN